MASKTPPAPTRGSEETPEGNPSPQDTPKQQQAQTGASAQMQGGPRPPRFRDWASI